MKQVQFTRSLGSAAAHLGGADYPTVLIILDIFFGSFAQAREENSFRLV